MNEDIDIPCIFKVYDKKIYKSLLNKHKIKTPLKYENLHNFMIISKNYNSYTFNIITLKKQEIKTPESIQNHIYFNIPDNISQELYYTIEKHIKIKEVEKIENLWFLTDVQNNKYCINYDNQFTYKIYKHNKIKEISKFYKTKKELDKYLENYAKYSFITY